MNSNFKYFVPIDKIEKATKLIGGKSTEIMKISGVASTLDQDTDGEILDPNGFNVDYFMNSGHISYGHKQENNPNFIIGFPTKCEVKNNQFHIEAELYPWSQLAKDVYEVASNLKKSGTGRKLGWSIEGKATLRDPLNDKYVKKAAITGVTVTCSPKNSATFVEIMKGQKNGFEEEDLNENQIAANGGQTEFIIDITNEQGMRMTVDKNFQIKKSMTTTNSSAVMHEDVEKKVHNLTNVDAAVILCKAHEMNLLSDYQFSLIKNKIK